MSEYALVERGMVVNISNGAADFPFAPDDVPIDGHDPRPQIGWRYDVTTGTFAPPLAFPLGERATKLAAVRAVNEAAGVCRAQYLTVVPGQAETYLLKADEVSAYDTVMAAGGDITPSDYPILSAEAAATGSTLADTAQAVRTTRLQWIQLAATVEGIRRGAITAIERATTEADVNAAIPGTWP